MIRFDKHKKKHLFLNNDDSSKIRCATIIKFAHLHASASHWQINSKADLYKKKQNKTHNAHNKMRNKLKTNISLLKVRLCVIRNLALTKDSFQMAQNNLHTLHATLYFSWFIKNISMNEIDRCPFYIICCKKLCLTKKN